MYIVLGHTKIVINRLLVELRMLKMLLMSMLLETEGKRILAIIIAESLGGLCPIIMWEAEVISSELSYLAEEICKQSIKSVAWFPLAVYTKT